MPADPQPAGQGGGLASAIPLCPAQAGSRSGFPVPPTRRGPKLSLSPELAHKGRVSPPQSTPGAAAEGRGLPAPHGEPRVTFQRLLLGRFVAGTVRLPVGVLQGVLQAQLVADLEGLSHRAHHPHRLALRSKPAAAQTRGKPSHRRWENWESSSRFPPRGCPTLPSFPMPSFLRCCPPLDLMHSIPPPRSPALGDELLSLCGLCCCPGWARRGQAPGTFFWGHPAPALPRSLPRVLHPPSQQLLWVPHGKVRGPSETSRLGVTQP